jgi:hypothetical protein
MTHATHTIGDATSVKDRFGCEPFATAATGANSIRPEKLLDVLAFNNTGGVLYLQVHEIAPGINVATPIDTAVPLFSFPVQGGLGGTLGRSVDIQGIYCCWSTTSGTKTLVAAASGSINIIVKG